jgi:excisionase family DNA binding protein
MREKTKPTQHGGDFALNRRPTQNGSTQTLYLFFPASIPVLGHALPTKAGLTFKKAKQPNSDEAHNPGNKPMKTTQNPQNYFSTSQAAKVLGLSVGTVQRMVQNGVFKAFVTHGGHRRILSTSLNDYCQKQGVSTSGLVPAHPVAQIYVLHDGAHMTPALSDLSAWSCVTVMTHPLDLMDMGQELAVLFVDARMSWLHTSPAQLHNARMQNTHIILYNSEHLPANSLFTESQNLHLFAGDISTDLVDGYLLCLQQQPETTRCH